jgi:YfiH family protein
MIDRSLDFIHADWPTPNWVYAVTTTRHGGTSVGNYGSANLADHVGDHQQTVSANRQLLRQQLALPQDPRWLSQQHGNRVVQAEHVTIDNRADASICANPGVVCAVLTADCLPILLCDATERRIAAIHAGWRGLCAGIIEATITALGSAPEALTAWLGPAIRATHYQVRIDVRETLLSYRADLEQTLLPDSQQHWQLDLPKAAKLILNAEGVVSVWDSQLCTYCDERFFSYRRSGQTGRTASLIWMGD